MIVLHIEIDLLVIGAGIAGLCAAQERLRAGLRMAIAWTGPGASPHVLGYNALSYNMGDSAESYYRDMLCTGENINYKKLVERLVAESEKLNMSLAESGFFPDTDSYGIPLRRLLGGCSFPRTCFSLDSTGSDIIQALLPQNR